MRTIADLKRDHRRLGRLLALAEDVGPTPEGASAQGRAQKFALLLERELQVYEALGDADDMGDPRESADRAWAYAPAWVKDPRYIEPVCPVCGSPSGEQCTDLEPTGYVIPPHPARVRAYAARRAPPTTRASEALGREMFRHLMPVTAALLEIEGTSPLSLVGPSPAVALHPLGDDTYDP